MAKLVDLIVTARKPIFNFIRKNGPVSVNPIIDYVREEIDGVTNGNKAKLVEVVIDNLKNDAWIAKDDKDNYDTTKLGNYMADQKPEPKRTTKRKVWT